MGENLVYVRIDVDDVRYHGCALNPRTGEILDFHCRPTLNGLVDQLERLRDYLRNFSKPSSARVRCRNQQISRAVESNGCILHESTNGSDVPYYTKG